MQGLAGWSAREDRKRVLIAFFELSIKIHTQTVPASHRALPEDLGGARGGPRSAPTSWTAPTEMSRHGKGVNLESKPCALRGWEEMQGGRH